MPRMFVSQLLVGGGGDCWGLRDRRQALREAFLRETDREKEGCWSEGVIGEPRRKRSHSSLMPNTMDMCEVLPRMFVSQPGDRPQQGGQVGRQEFLRKEARREAGRGQEQGAGGKWGTMAASLSTWMYMEKRVRPEKWCFGVGQSWIFRSRRGGDSANCVQMLLAPLAGPEAVPPSPGHHPFLHRRTHSSTEHCRRRRRIQQQHRDPYNCCGLHLQWGSQCMDCCCDTHAALEDAHTRGLLGTTGGDRIWSLVSPCVIAAI